MNTIIEIKNKQTKCNLNSRTAGFTLIELLIVVSIMATLAIAGGMELFNFFRNQNLQDDASKIAFILRGARDKSISQEEGQGWGVHFDNTSVPGSYVLFRGASFASSTLYENVVLNTNVKFISPASGTTADILFSKVTGLSSGPSSIIISLTDNPGVIKTISINTNGEISY